jgi:hypothetical protein
VTVEEIDAHLYAVGITRDARGTLVLLTGDESGLLDRIADELAVFGADTVWLSDVAAECHKAGTFDHVIASSPSCWAVLLAEKWLKPGGRLLMLLPFTESDTIEVINVVMGGGPAVRIECMKPREENVT